MRGGRPAAALRCLVAIADLPGDDDDARLRKRAGVVAGIITVLAPLTVPLEASAQAFAVLIGLGLSIYSVVNLVVLARTRRFERYVVALIAAGSVFVVAATAATGGVAIDGGGMVWSFLVPGYAILAPGPRRATPWFLVFLGTIATVIVIDPVVRQAVPAPPHIVQLLSVVPGIALPLTIVFLLLRYTDIRRRQAEARSDELLTNAIPPSIALRLTHGEDRIAEAYAATTVVFADIVGFTPWSQRTDPSRVVALLDDLFSRFDGLAVEHGIEKIKTVGDAYMAVAGAPEQRPDHAEAALGFAQAVLAEATDWRRSNAIDLQVRVGLASGPAVGGVIGRRRLLFDLWGDTVNTAARMESSGIPDRIHIAASTRALLDDRVTYESRVVDVKGLGPMTTYLVGAGSPREARSSAAPHPGCA